MQKLCWQLRRQGKSIGLVPTMGALHQGHLSLMRKARKQNDCLVISIFVNPTQFGPGEDYRRYPRDLKKDKRTAKEVGVDVIFAPSVEEMYPEPYLTYVKVEKITEGLCGAFRPGHFRGVTTVVLKLFNIVQPDRAYFGQKDYQQYVVIKKMAEDLNLPTEIICCPIVREKDGLAMSSRNQYLNREERKQATVLYEALKMARRLVHSPRLRQRVNTAVHPYSRGRPLCRPIFGGQARSIVHSKELITKMEKIIKKSPLAKIEYIKIVHPETLEEIKNIKPRLGGVIALAVRIGKARLIDNILVGSKK